MREQTAFRPQRREPRSHKRGQTPSSPSSCSHVCPSRLPHQRLLRTPPESGLWLAQHRRQTCYPAKHDTQIYPEHTSGPGPRAARDPTVTISRAEPQDKTRRRDSARGPGDPTRGPVRTSAGRAPSCQPCLVWARREGRRQLRFRSTGVKVRPQKGQRGGGSPGR